MPVYMVYVCHGVSDRAQLEKYSPTRSGPREGLSLHLADVAMTQRGIR